MNMNTKYYSIFACLLIVLVGMTSCQSDEFDNVSPAPADNGLRFKVDDIATRLGYDGVLTTFSETDEIGCIIYDGSTYINSKWKYSGGYLLPDGNNSIVSEDAQRGGYLNVSGPGPYKFYFYYPYDVDLDVNDVSRYAFSVETDQSNIINASASDFLWVNIPEDTEITSVTNRTFNLRFQKKTATIIIEGDVALSDVSLEGTLNKDMVIDLQSGVILESNNAEESKFTPLASDYNKTFRLMLPQQDVTGCTLSFTLKGKSKTINLSQNIKSLEAGKVYTIHITAKGETKLEISDWNNVTVADGEWKEVE